MRKIFALISICFMASLAWAQDAAPVPGGEKFGSVGMDDLQMQFCNFEKDANAEVLFKVGKLYYDDDLKSIIKEVHIRVKFFNDKDLNLANIKIPFYSYERAENITGLEAETVNLADGKPVFTKVDKKQFFTTPTDKFWSEISFAMPQVKAGSVIEFQYKLTQRYNAAIDPWVFQDVIPTRYCEYNTSIPDVFYFRTQPHFWQPLYKHITSVIPQVLKLTSHEAFSTGSDAQQTESLPYNDNTEVWVLANIPSVRVDNYMSSLIDNEQRIALDLVSMKPIGGFNEKFSDTWAKVGSDLIDDEDFGSQLNRSLTDEKDIIDKASQMKTDDEKIAFLFDYVKDAMKWNGTDRWYTNVGTSKAWDNKSGNGTEINLILYHLLKKSGVDAYPMVVSTRENGKIDEYYTSLLQFNRGVVYIPVDSTKSYVLDASNKYNLYNEIPANLLNSKGLYIDKTKRTYGIKDLKSTTPTRQVVLINAEISPDSKVSGTVQVNATDYAKIDAASIYKKQGEEEYIKAFRNGVNSLKIKSLKMEHMDVDTLPLTQSMDFTMDLGGSDQNYIYFKPDLFSPLNDNPFLGENRLTDIDFVYQKNYSVSGVYKIPAGYKVDALPKNEGMTMPDKSFSFKRFAVEQDGAVTVRYVFDCRKVELTPDEYPAIHDFFKKMYEMLDEQIVLKKS